MTLPSSADNIRYNGTGRCYSGEVGGASFDELGDLETLNYNMAITTEKVKTNRNASKATILEVESDRETGVTFGLREMTNENLKMALLASTISTLNQSASYVNQVDPTMVDDLYIDLGHLNVFSTKLTGTIVGTLAVGDDVTQDSPAATGKIAFKGADHIVLVNVSGTFTVGEEVYETSSTNYITPTGVAVAEDVVVTDVTGATRRVQGTDYSLDPDYGYIRQLSAGTTAETDVVSYDYEAVEKEYMHAMAASSVQKKLIFVSDKDDQGRRTRWTFHKVQILLDGDFPLIGDGAAILSVIGTILADTTQATGEEYYKVEMIG